MTLGQTVVTQAAESLPQWASVGGAVFGGTAVGGSIVVWFAKVMFQRTLKQYDGRHDKHEDRLMKLADRFSDALSNLKVEVSALRVTVDHAKGIGEKVDGLAVKIESAREQARADIHRIKNDVDEAHTRIRLLTQQPTRLPRPPG